MTTVHAHDQADVLVMNPDTGAVLSTAFTRSSFEDLLDRHELFTAVDQTIRSALNSARERGYDEDKINSVLMVGGSSQIPSVHRVLRQIFGKDRVHTHRPMDAVARGAAGKVRNDERGPEQNIRCRGVAELDGS